MVRYWGACTFGSLCPQKSLNLPLQVRVVVTHHDDWEFLDCLTHAETVMHRVVSFEVDLLARVHEQFICLTYAVPASEHLYVIIPPHNTISTPQMIGMLFGGCMPSLRELVLGWGSETSARSPHPLRTCSLNFSLVSIVADTLGSKERLRLKGIAGNAVIFSVPSACAELELAVAGE